MIKNCSFFKKNSILKAFFWTYWMQFWHLAAFFHPKFKNKLPLNESLPENDKLCINFTKVFYFPSWFHRTHILKTWQRQLFPENFFWKVVVDTWKAVLTTLLSDFCQVTENSRQFYKKWNICFSYEKRFSSNLSTWHVQCSLNKPLKSFPIKSWIVFAQNTNFFLEKPMLLDFFSGHVKNRFGNLSGRNCQGPNFFLP